MGGEQREAAIGAMGDHGRIVLCGMVSSYSGETPHGPRNLGLFIKHRLAMTGFTGLEDEQLRADFEAPMRRWIIRNDVVIRSTRFQGLDALPQTFSSLLKGETVGRTIVRTD